MFFFNTGLIIGILIEGSFEVKLPTIWTDEKQSRAEAERRERLEERRVEEKESEERRYRCAKESQFTVFFQWFVAPEGRKVGSLKRRVRSQLARWEMKNCTLLWREAHFEVKMYKTPQLRTTFGSCDVEKVHAVVARSTFPSQNAQNTPVSDHFWKLRCRKSARRCGAKYISKSKCTKHTSVGPLLEVAMSKKCTPLWREAHFQVKMYKTHQCRTTFGSSDVEKVHAVVARSTFPSQNVQNTPVSDHFWKFRCRKSARRCGAKHISKSKCTKHHMFAPLLEVRMLKKCTPLWREAHCEVKMYKTLGVRTTFGGSDVVSLHYTTLHYTTLHNTTQHYNHNYTTTQVHNYTTTQLHNYTPLHSTTLNYTPLHSTTLNYTPLHYTTFHYTSLHYITLHSTTTTTTTTQLHSTTLHYTKLHYTTLHYTTLHYTTLHYTTFHYTSLHDTRLHSTTLQLQLQLHSTTLHYTKLHYTTLHYTTLHYIPLHYTTLHYTTLHCTKLHYSTLHCTTLHYTTFHYTPLHYITLHYITLNDTAPQIDR